MSDSTSKSVSKGVFVFKGKKTVAKAEDYFCDDEIPSKMEDERYQVYDELSESINAKIQVLQSDLNTKIFEDLLKFVENGHRGFSLEATTKRKAIEEIPTAALVTGVNIPDHGVMFANLVAILKERSTPHVAILKSKDCSTLRTIKSQMMSQLMSYQDQLDEESDEEEVTAALKVTTNRCTMPVLASWFRNNVKLKKQLSAKERLVPQLQDECARQTNGKAPESPRKKSRLECAVPPIVIVLEDFERFAPDVVQDFIVICSYYLAQLPFVLVFGIATSVSVVHQLLCDSVSSHLCMERFQAPPSTQFLAQVINQVVMSPEIPFKLGTKSLDLLLDIFLYHDFSVINFVRGFQLALMEHFHTEPCSVLCQPLNSALASLQDMTNTQLDLIRTCPSFRRYVESVKAEQQVALLEDDAATKKTIASCLHKLNRHSLRYLPVLRCLHTLVCKLPHYPLGKYLRELYALSLSRDIFDAPAYLDAQNLIKTLSRNELQAMLAECRIHLSPSGTLPDDLVTAELEIGKLHLKFENIEELAKECQDDADNEGKEKEMQQLPKKMDMYTLRKTLVEREKTKKRTVYEVLREDTVTYMDNLFKKHLVCPSQLVLHEIYYNNNASVLRGQLHASPRATIQRALANPYHYLQCDTLKLGGASISPLLPDLCIVYKLHLECGRLINLYDWLQAFIMIVNSGDLEKDENTEPSSLNKPDIHLQARFIRAVSELQFLGFIKPTKRKTDHVARLTW